MVEITGVLVGSILLLFVLFQFFKTISSWIIGLLFNRVTLIIGIIAFVLAIIVPDVVQPYYATIFEWVTGSLGSLLSIALDLLDELIDSFTS